MKWRNITVLYAD